jgi:hypothetical protein
MRHGMKRKSWADLKGSRGLAVRPTRAIGLKDDILRGLVADHRCTRATVWKILERSSLSRFPPKAPTRLTNLENSSALQDRSAD